MELNNILKLIDAVSSSSLSSFSLENKDVKLNFENVKSNSTNHIENKNITSVDNSNGILENVTLSESNILSENCERQVSESNISDIKENVSCQNIISPLVGTFYNAQSPKDEPFVKVGDTVKKGQIIGIVEAMKLMNEIESEYDGVVKEILVNNEDIVEYGQSLFVIKV